MANYNSIEKIISAEIIRTNEDNLLARVLEIGKRLHKTLDSADIEHTRVVGEGRGANLYHYSFATFQVHNSDPRQCN